MSTVTIMLERTVGDLVEERERVLRDVGLDADELRERAFGSGMTRSEARALRRLEEINFLLGED